MAQVYASPAGTAPASVGAVVPLALPLGSLASGVTAREVVCPPENHGLRAGALALLADIAALAAIPGHSLTLKPVVTGDTRTLNAVFGHRTSSCESWYVLIYFRTLITSVSRSYQYSDYFLMICQ